MPPHVVIIEDDAWILKLLSGVVSAQGFVPVTSRTAREGFEQIVAVEPVCIVCDIDLPDHEGYWVARKVRSHPSRVSAIPLMFLSARDDEASRKLGFDAGGDVYMTKPFRMDEVGAQIDALVELSARVQERRDSLLAEAADERSAMSGDVRQLSVSTMLSVLGMERRSGILRIRTPDETAEVGLASGCVERVTIGAEEVSLRDGLGRVVTWRRGEFEFEAAPKSIPPSQPQDTVAALLLDATRIVDEASFDDPSLKPGSSDRPSFEPDSVRPATQGFRPPPPKRR